MAAVDNIRITELDHRTELFESCLGQAVVTRLPIDVLPSSQLTRTRKLPAPIMMPGTMPLVPARMALQ